MRRVTLAVAATHLGFPGPILFFQPALLTALFCGVFLNLFLKASSYRLYDKPLLASRQAAMHHKIPCGGGRVGVELGWAAPARGGDGAETGDEVEQRVLEGEVGGSRCQGGSRRGEGGIAHRQEHGSLPDD